MTERLRVVLPVVAVIMCAAGVTRAAIVGKGTDGKMYLSLDEDEVETLGGRMRLMADEIARLKAERKTECGLI